MGIFRAVKEDWRAKNKEHRRKRYPSHDKEGSPHRCGPSPTHFEEKHK
jgi:hypothetical protein